MDSNSYTKRHFHEQVRDNSWFIQTKLLRIGIGELAVPASVFPLAILALFHHIFLYLIGVVVATYILTLRTGVSPSHYMRWIRKFLNGGKTHAHPLSRKRTSFMTIGLSALALSVLMPASASADIRLILPPKKQGQQQATVERNMTVIPLLERGIIKQGFAVDLPLEHVMKTLQLKTWVVKYRDPELKALNVSWRSVDMDLLDIYQDLASRYSIAFRYSNRTGEMYVEWATEECESGYDKAGIFQLIC